MNIENLKTFCLVVEEGSISQAARLSYISQPAVTRQIHQLENFYEALLFDRTDGKLRVTEAGKVLYPFAKAITNDFSRSKERIQHITGKRSHHLRVGASLTIGEFLLPSLLGKFKKQQPDVKVTLSVRNTPSIIEDLSNDIIDLALVEGIVENNDLIVETFAHDELILVCSADHPWKARKEIDVEELIHERMIWRESMSGTRLIIESMLGRYSVLDRMESYMELGSTQAIKSTVEAGLGISILSQLAVARELQSGLLYEVKMKGVEIKRDLWLVRKPQRFDRMSVSSFIEFIKKQQ